MTKTKESSGDMALGLQGELIRSDQSGELAVLEKDVLKSSRKVILREGVDTGKICLPGYDYCFECGHIDKPEAFRKEDRCPNPKCIRPWSWDD